MTSHLRDLPSVQRVLSEERVRRLVQLYSHDAVVELVRSELDAARETVRTGGRAPVIEEIAAAVEGRASSSWQAWPDRVINATGVVLHTNLGRAPLSRDALDAIQRAAEGYGDLEMDLKSGRRGSRQDYVSALVCQVTGAEAALVVNNNASALLLGLAAVAADKEVIVSRGEAIEIGGGFRIPDVLRQSGADLVEVGTTNRTYVGDFEAAITEGTGAILSAHASNFKVTGFTHAPDLSELVALGRERGVHVLHDLGSGCLLDTARYGLAHEPMPQESVAAGVSLAFFSGDKLLGGPQAGIITGDATLVSTVAKHPLARAVRIDKLNIAALTATLVHYLKGEAAEKVPVWRMLSESAGALELRARRWAGTLGQGCSVVSGRSAIGGGSLPGESLPTSLLSLDAGDAPGGATGLAAALRAGEPPVIARIDNERVVLDPRTVLPDEEEPLLRIVASALKQSTIERAESGE
jgi:L-seryl-tRNA(Ser) seleniumtransferase